MVDDPYRYFRIEARELLDHLTQGVLDLEKGPAPPDLVAGLLRHAHTLKGAARVVKQRRIADHAHAIEDTLEPFRTTTTPVVPRDRLEHLLGLLDEMSSHVIALAAPADGGAGPSHGAADPVGPARADPSDIDAVLAGVTEAVTQLDVLRLGMNRIGRAQDLVGLMVEQLTVARGTPRPDPSIPDDRAPSMAEELRSIFADLDRDLEHAARRIDQELRQVRDAGERLRLVPAGSLFTSLERSARDVAQEHDKEVVFEGRGGHIRLDIEVLSTVEAALQQIVRNAVAHGIESRDERRAAGKPAGGRVTVEVARRGQRVVFTCGDDGRGVNLDALREALRRRSTLPLPTPDLTPQDLFRLLLEGGVTTSGTVTEVAGRGIGLDVLRHAAACLSGETAIESAPGQGTTVELAVPISLTSAEVIVVEAGGTTATIALDAVQSAVRIAAGDVAWSPDGATIVHGNHVIPFLPLAQVLPTRSSQPPRARSWSAVIVEGAQGAVAIGTDRVIGTKNLVVRPLPGLAAATPVVSGVSADARGKPQVVLDPDGLIAHANHEGATRPPADKPQQAILIVDDSLTTRMLEQSILESAGYTVDLATSGEEALQMIEERSYGLYLVDVEMPGMDGFTFIEQARSNAGTRHVPSILVTSRMSAEDHARGVDVGAAAYVVKSDFDQGELLDRIRELTAD